MSGRPSRLRLLRARARQARRRWSQLAAAERVALLEALALLPVVHGLQQRLPFKRWRELLERAPRRARPRGPRPSVDQIGWAVETARRWVPGEYKCLPAAYSVFLLLRRHGYDPRLRVGVAHDDRGQLEAHAWVEHAGRTVIGELDDLSRFVPLPTTTGAEDR